MDTRRKVGEEMNENVESTQHPFNHTWKLTPGNDLWPGSTEDDNGDADIRCEHPNDESKYEAGPGHASMGNQTAEASDVAANSQMCRPAKINFQAIKAAKSEQPLQAFKTAIFQAPLSECKCIPDAVPEVECDDTLESSEDLSRLAKEQMPVRTLFDVVQQHESIQEITDVAANSQMCKPAKIQFEAIETAESEKPSHGFKAAPIYTPLSECEEISDAVPEVECGDTLESSEDLSRRAKVQIPVRTLFDVVQQHEPIQEITERQAPYVASPAWMSTSPDIQNGPFRRQRRQRVRTQMELLGHICRHLTYAQGGLFIVVRSIYWRPCHHQYGNNIALYIHMCHHQRLLLLQKTLPQASKKPARMTAVSASERARRFKIITLSLRFERS